MQMTKKLPIQVPRFLINKNLLNALSQSIDFSNLSLPSSKFDRSDSD